METEYSAASSFLFSFSFCLAFSSTKLFQHKALQARGSWQFMSDQPLMSDQPQQDKPQQQFSLGGQALIEGVMMRSPRYVGAAVRRADGTIEKRLEAFTPLTKKNALLGLPFVRGVFGLVEMLSLGMKYLQWSANVALEDEKKKELPTSSDEIAPSTSHATLNAESPTVEVQAAPPSLPIWMFLLTAAGSFGLGLLLFVALPNLVTDWTVKPFTNNLIALNAVEGAIKLVIFIVYVWSIGLKPDIRRVFEYHGAEHKVVYAAENDLPITPESARPFDTPHPRCGTGFALLTVFVSIVCFVFLPWPEEHWKRVGWRFLLMPVVAGVSYEIIKLTLNPTFSALAKAIMIPGMWLQRLTTRQPDDSQLEVSCEAMKLVMEAEHSHEAVAKPGLV
jgi:uncharacterized protein YqhQ